MKTIYILLAWAGCAIAVLGANDVLSERSVELMTGLNVMRLDGKPNISHSSNVLSEAAFEGFEGLIVKHKEASIKSEEQVVDEYVLADQNGHENCSVKLAYHRSVRDAQDALFEKLAMNSLPMNLLVKRYQIDNKGPGDLCVIDNLKPRIYFLRGNVIVCVASLIPDVYPEDIARKVDNALIGRE